MRKFKRKGNRDNDQQQTPTRKLKTEYDERSQSSQSTTKNISFDEMSLSGKQLSFTNGSSGTYFLFSALNRHLQKKVMIAFQNIKSKSEAQKRKVCESSRISLSGSRILERLKIGAFHRIKQEKQRNCLKKEAIFMIQQCTSGIDQRMKYQSLITLLNTINSSIREENKSLRQIESKYRQNQIPEQYIRSFFKFIKINPKNYKAFTKSSEQVIQTSIDPILKALEGKKSNKSSQTNSQVLMMIIKNYVISSKDSAIRMNISQNQTKAAQKEKEEVIGLFKNYQKEIEHSLKQLSKFDNDLVSKVDEMISTQFNPTAIKCTQRAIQYQLKICENKKQNSYLYQSRILTLKSIQSILSRFTSNAEPLNKPQNLSSSRLKSKSTMSTSRSEVIRQKNVIQQCDALEQIENITNNMFVLLTKDYSLDKVGKYISQNTQRQKIDILPQVRGIRHNFTKIAEYHKDLLQKYEEKMNSVEVEEMRKKLQQVQEKIEEMSSKLSLLDKNKVEQVDKIAKEFEKKSQKYQATIMTLEKKIEQVSEELELRNKKIESINRKNEKKLGLINQQYRNITKIVSKIDEDKMEKNKSIEDIVERSLSKSRSKLFTSGQLTPIQRLTPQCSSKKLLQNSQLSIPLSMIQGSSLINSNEKRNLEQKVSKETRNSKEFGKARQTKITIFDDDEDEIQFNLEQEKKASNLKTQKLRISDSKKNLIFNTPKKEGRPITVVNKTAKQNNNIVK